MQYMHLLETPFPMFKQTTRVGNCCNYQKPFNHMACVPKRTSCSCLHQKGMYANKCWNFWNDIIVQTNSKCFPTFQKYTNEIIPIELMIKQEKWVVFKTATHSPDRLPIKIKDIHFSPICTFMVPQWPDKVRRTH